MNFFFFFFFFFLKKTLAMPNDEFYRLCMRTSFMGAVLTGTTYSEIVCHYLGMSVTLLLLLVD